MPAEEVHALQPLLRASGPYPSSQVVQRSAVHKRQLAPQSAQALSATYCLEAQLANNTSAAQVLVSDIKM
jgi:hypothetical protein